MFCGLSFRPCAAASSPPHPFTILSAQFRVRRVNTARPARHSALAALRCVSCALWLVLSPPARPSAQPFPLIIFIPHFPPHCRARTILALAAIPPPLACLALRCVPCTSLRRLFVLHAAQPPSPLTTPLFFPLPRHCAGYVPGLCGPVFLFAMLDGHIPRNCWRSVVYELRGGHF